MHLRTRLDIRLSDGLELSGGVGFDPDHAGRAPVPHSKLDAVPGLPERGGIYVFELWERDDTRDDQGVCVAVYVGESGNLSRRVAEYVTASSPGKVERTVRDTQSATTEEYVAANIALWMRTGFPFNNEALRHEVTFRRVVHAAESKTELDLDRKDNRLLVEAAVLHAYASTSEVLLVLNDAAQDRVIITGLGTFRYRRGRTPAHVSVAVDRLVERREVFVVEHAKDYL